MKQPEITPYGDNPFGDAPSSYSGMLYRFDGAEHIAVERSDKNVHLSFSTTEEAADVRTQYEMIFGTPAILEPVEDDEIEDEEYRESSVRVAEAAMVLGPMCVMVVDTDEFSLGWVAPDQVFHDRPDKTAVIHMHQESPEIDFRHKALVAALAQENVRAYLDIVLPE